MLPSLREPIGTGYTREPDLSPPLFGPWLDGATKEIDVKLC